MTTKLRKWFAREPRRHRTEEADERLKREFERREKVVRNELRLLKMIASEGRRNA